LLMLALQMYIMQLPSEKVRQESFINDIQHQTFSVLEIKM